MTLRWGVYPGFLVWVQRNYGAPKSGKERGRRDHSDEMLRRTQPAFGGFENREKAMSQGVKVTSTC